MSSKEPTSGLLQQPELSTCLAKSYCCRAQSDTLVHFLLLWTGFLRLNNLWRKAVYFADSSGCCKQGVKEYSVPSWSSSFEVLVQPHLRSEQEDTWCMWKRWGMKGFLSLVTTHTQTNPTPSRMSLVHEGSSSITQVPPIGCTSKSVASKYSTLTCLGKQPIFQLEQAGFPMRNPDTYECVLTG